MKTFLRIKEASIWRDYSESEFPIAVGLSTQGAITFGKAAETNPRAWLGFNDGHVFLELVDGGVVQHNGIELRGSRWLIAGDEIQIDAAAITVEMDAGIVLLSPISNRNVPVLTPPSKPLLPTGHLSGNRSPDEQIFSHAKPTGDKQAETRTEVGDPSPSQKVKPRLPTEQNQKDCTVSDNPAEVHSNKKVNEQTECQAEIDTPSFPANKLPLSTEKNQDTQSPSIDQTPDDPHLPLADTGNPHPPDDTGEMEFTRLPGTQDRSRLRNVIVVLFLLLLVCVTLVLIAVPLQVVVTPAPDSLLLKGLIPPLKVKERYLALPGNYRVVAEKEGYHTLHESFKVESGSEPTLAYELRKRPGLLDIVSTPITGAEIRIGDRTVGQTPMTSLELEAGRYEIAIVADRYLPAVTTVDIQGLGKKQSIEVTLLPGWGTLEVDSQPRGANVWLDGMEIGRTPLKSEPMRGDYQLELKKEGWKTERRNVKISPSVILSLPIVELQKIDGVLALTSEPLGANVTLNGEFRGQTPLSLPLVSDQDYQLGLSLSGFMGASQTVRVEGETTTPVHVQLEPEYGTVFVITQPADANLVVDGQAWPGTRRMRLTAVPHQVEVTKEGYETYRTEVTPTAGVSKKLIVELRSKSQVIAEAVHEEIRTVEGQVLRRIPLQKPVKFQMGTSRRESGRRSNERQYLVELTRTFDISEKEVTNAEFQRFRQDHNSGLLDGFDLNEADQPATSVTWDHATAYLNWLSQKEGLPPAYEKKDGKMVPVVPMTVGYRLPTEAEWAFVARYEGEYREKPLRFPWGKERNPPKNAGNYADSSAADVVSVSVENYDDGFRVAAPVGTYPANKLGIYDLGGNVSEWCHDYYDVYLGSQITALRDPMGPAAGEYHVVRGASWRHGNEIELRPAYRDSIEASRDDLGFRIARYAEEHVQE